MNRYSDFSGLQKRDFTFDIFQAIPGATTREHSWLTLPLTAEPPLCHTQV